jgi:hypothetical protein
VGGFSSVFPAIFMTTMVSLWVAQGESCPRNAVFPMVIGSSSVGFYSMMYAGLVADAELSPLAGAPVAWILAVLSTSLPSAYYLRWYQNAAHDHHHVVVDWAYHKALLQAGNGAKGSPPTCTPSSESETVGLANASAYASLPDLQQIAIGSLPSTPDEGAVPSPTAAVDAPVAANPQPHAPSFGSTLPHLHIPGHRAADAW